MGKYQIRATFFVVGEASEKCPELVKLVGAIPLNPLNPIHKKVSDRLKESGAYAIARAMVHGYRATVRSLGARNNLREKVISLHADGSPRGKVLFSYIIDGFLISREAAIPNTHTNIWQSVCMAKTFLSLGYEVDVIHYLNQNFKPKDDYTAFVDVRYNLQRLAPLMNADCIKIMHIDSANIVFHNAAEARRLLELQQRRGITLRPRRFEKPNLCIEHADCATTCGNDFTIGTFAYANKKIYKLPSPCGILLDRPVRDVERTRKRFIWFSSSGSVHKGLDLALDAFKQMPDCHLTVCGPVDRDFAQAYHDELYATENIDTVGWLDLDSEEFKSLTGDSVAMLHLSCSEGGAPSIKMCLHAGLIPIVSYESGVDVDDFGVVLKDCTVENIQKAVKHVSSLPSEEVEQMGKTAWEHARRHYTRENFAREYRRVVAEILDEARR